MTSSRAPTTSNAWLKTWLEVESAAPVVTDRELKLAEARVYGRENPPPNPW